MMTSKLMKSLYYSTSLSCFLRSSKKTIKFIKFCFTKIFLGGELYSGTVADFSGSDALIIKDQLRTEQYDFKHLNGKCLTEKFIWKIIFITFTQNNNLFLKIKVVPQT